MLSNKNDIKIFIYFSLVKINFFFYISEKLLSMFIIIRLPLGFGIYKIEFYKMYHCIDQIMEGS